MTWDEYKSLSVEVKWLENELSYWKERALKASDEAESLKRSNSALRGQITKLKKKKR